MTSKGQEEDSPRAGDEDLEIPSVDVLGVPISAIDMDTALATIDGWVRRREPNFVCVRDVHGVMESQRDQSLLEIHRQAGMVTPDGMPLVWLSRLQGFQHVERVYGPELMLACCEMSVSRGYRHFFYGGHEGVADRLAERLTERYPGLIVTGTFSPPFRSLTEPEDEQVVAHINEAEPDLVWVGLSTPKQEYWMHSHVGRLRAPVLLGVGAAFDFLSGAKRQAPPWMGRSGLEWLFRMATEPRRLGPRYVINNPSFIWRVAQQQVRSAHRRQRDRLDRAF